jgi:hypothetical protein
MTPLKLDRNPYKLEDKDFLRRRERLILGPPRRGGPLELQYTKIYALFVENPCSTKRKWNYTTSNQ